MCIEATYSYKIYENTMVYALCVYYLYKKKNFKLD